MSPSPPALGLGAALLRPAWSVSLEAQVTGLALAREAQSILAWDANHWLTLFNHRGERQAQLRLAGLAAACAADDGSAFAAVGQRGEAWWLAPDLAARWQRPVRKPAVACCLDPHGQYLAVADAQGVHLFDRHGRPLWTTPTPRPLHHLCFVPEQPRLLGCADVGLVLALDLDGQVAWRDGLATQVGSLTVTDSGDRLVLACFSEGLRLYNAKGEKQGPQPLPEPCRLAKVSYDGRRTLAIGLGQKVMLLDRDGGLLDMATADEMVTAAALDPLGDRVTLALADGRLLQAGLGSR
jgi:hypothetical protein